MVLTMMIHLLIILLFIYSNGPIDIVVHHNGAYYAIQCKDYKDPIGNYSTDK